MINVWFKKFFLTKGTYKKNPISPTSIFERVCLSVADETALEQLLVKLSAYGVPWQEFRESDVDHQLTAFCILGTEFIRSKLRHISPALRGNKNKAIKDLTAVAK